MFSSPTNATPMPAPTRATKSHRFVQARIMNPIYSGMIVVDPPLESHHTKPDELVFLPLNEVKIDATIHESLAFVRMEQEFASPEAAPGTVGRAFEVIYKFPKLPASVISRLTVGIADDRIIETMVVEKLEAESRYDDAVAAGPGAVQLKEDKDIKELYQLDIGLIKPGQRVKIEMQILQPLAIQNGGYEFKLPMCYLPVMPDWAMWDYIIDFHFRFAINASQIITEVSHPKDWIVKKSSAFDVVLEKMGHDLNSIVHGKGLGAWPSCPLQVMYRTKNMDEPRLLFQKCSGMDGHVAVMAQFLPTFEAKQPEETPDGHKIEFNDDSEQLKERLMEKQFDDRHHEEKINFFFIVDRSGSMGYPMSKMETTKQALQLFMMSLPAGCSFQIISYGSRVEWLGGGKQKKMFDYNDDTLQYAKIQIERFVDNFDGTDIYTPLNEVLKSKLNSNKKQRIFLLTDGEVDAPNQVIDLIKYHCNRKKDNRVFTFGVGDEADQYLVEQSARAGRGESYFVKNATIEELRAQVIDALQKATDPYMEGCSFLMCPTLDLDEADRDEESLMPTSIKLDLGDIHRNQLVQFFFIMKQEVFDNDEFVCQFKCTNDPRHQSVAFVEFTRDKFRSLEEQLGTLHTEQQDVHENLTQIGASFSLSKLAAKQQIDELEMYQYLQQNNRVMAKNISLKYQVLSEGTSFIGVIRCPDPSEANTDTGEMLTAEMSTIRAKLPRQGLDPNALYNQHVGIFLSGTNRQHSQHLNKMMLSSAQQYGSDRLSSVHDGEASKDDDDGFQEFQSAALKEQKNNFLLQRQDQTFEEEQPEPQKEAAKASESRKGSASGGGLFKSLFRKMGKQKSPELAANGRDAGAASQTEAMPSKKEREAQGKGQKELPVKKRKESVKKPQEAMNKHQKDVARKQFKELRHGKKVDGSTKEPKEGRREVGVASKDQLEQELNGMLEEKLDNLPLENMQVKVASEIFDEKMQALQVQQNNDWAAADQYLPVGSTSLQSNVTRNFSAQYQPLPGHASKLGVGANDYIIIINHCSASGFWAPKSQGDLLHYLKQERAKVEDFIQQGYKAKDLHIKPSQELTQYILTTLAIELLQAFFADKADEYRLIRRKAERWSDSFKSTSDKREGLENIEKVIRQSVQTLAKADDPK